MTGHLDTAATGTAGVFAALSQLWRLPGVSATHFPDHTPGIDLIAVRGAETCRVQVKSTQSDARRWRLPDDGRFPAVDLFILVEVHAAGGADAFFVIPTSDLAAATEASYERWRARHEGKHTETRFIGFDDPDSVEFLEQHRNRWHLILPLGGDT